MNTDQLKRMSACTDAREWAESQPNAYTAWRTCPRGDWLMWWLSRAGLDRKTLVLAACDCARLVLHLVPDGEDRPRVAIETAEAWARGEATIAQVRIAAAEAASAAMHKQCAMAVRKRVGYRTAKALWSQGEAK